MNYMDPDTGERVTAYLFAATMPYSQMIYVEAVTSMNEKAWLSCHVDMFQFFGGTPVKIGTMSRKSTS
ncbi:transposase [bacterium 1xD42-62]|uniref:Transposase n=1 Tax=Parablautia muri TaxID=2320879 RepID=A0A9X5GSX4_9FIRM|nr:transposase [Parablautia muri]